MTETNFWEQLGELLTAEFWAKEWAKSMSEEKLTPIMNFEFNILKAKVLIASAQEIMQVWPSIHERIIQDENIEIEEDDDDYEESPKSFSDALEPILDFFGTGVVSYFVYTEQALVTSVSATEVYLKDRFAYAIEQNPKVLKQFGDREIKVERLYDIGPDISKGIGKLIAEKIDFQKLDDVQGLYKKIYGFEPFSKKDLKKLKNIFAVRHLIIHKSGIVDKQYLKSTGKKFEEGERVCLERENVVEMIKYIEQLMQELETKLSEKETRSKSA